MEEKKKEREKRRNITQVISNIGNSKLGLAAAAASSEVSFPSSCWPHGRERKRERGKNNFEGTKVLKS